jgi:hypothetical protein
LSVLTGVFDQVTKAWLSAGTAVIVTLVAVADCATDPRCTVTPQSYSTTLHVMLTVDVSLVARMNSNVVDDAIRPAISATTGRFRFERVLNNKNDLLIVTAEESVTVVVPVAVLVVVPVCTDARGKHEADAAVFDADLMALNRAKLAVAGTSTSSSPSATA